MSGATFEYKSTGADFWYPLSVRDLWIPFVHCMMTILDEARHSSKYEHILLVEYYEWVARIALKYAELKKQALQAAGVNMQDAFRHEIVAEFVDKLLERQS